MSGWRELDHYGDDAPAATTGRRVSPVDQERDMEPFLNACPFVCTSSPLQPNDGSRQQTYDSRSSDGDLQGCGQLEKRWILWHEFMKEHAQLDAWLLLAEQAVITSSNSVHVTYTTARDELTAFERLQNEAGSRLVQLDGLASRNRTLTRLFRGAMRARLLALARECGRRWDDVSGKLESITARLKGFVSEWEEFEAEGEELSVWLANMEVRLTEVDHLNENTCEKLKLLQSFQQCVCENSGRVNALLQRGEELIQHSDPGDSQHVESRLLELVRHCSHVYNNIARTHTRLLSMRLVFEDDWIFSQASDSGCPSETVFEDDGGFDKPHLDVPPLTDHLKDSHQSAEPASPSDQPSPAHRPPPSSPSHEHLGLEWDPSVDIGRTVSCSDNDSSYFSISTGRCQTESLKRWSYLSSLSGWSDISNGVANKETDLETQWLEHDHPAAAAAIFSPAAAKEADPWLTGHQWTTSTPDRQDGEPAGFSGRRVRAWLGNQSSTLSQRQTSCSKAVQTDGEVEGEEEFSFCDEDFCGFSQRSGTSSTATAVPVSPSLFPSSLHSPTSLLLLLAAALAVLATMLCLVHDSPCHRSSRTAHGYHLTLRYVNGPPPT